MKYFLSHSSKDKQSIELIVEAIKLCEPELDLEKNLFCSSIPANGSDYKEELITNINTNITNADNIILVITENYLRSSFCFYEMSLARYIKTADKKIILIVQNESVAQLVDDIFPSKVFLHINASIDSAVGTLLKSFGYNQDAEDLLTEFCHTLSNKKTSAGIPYLGMSQSTYDSKYRFIEEYGVEKAGVDYPTTPEVAESKLADAQEIYFVSTTGSGFLKTFKELLVRCVSKGCNLSLAICDKNSSFGKDVAEIEAFNKTYDYSITKQNNEERIANEFKATFQYLNEIFIATRDSKTAGTIRCSSSYTLIRQTALIARKKSGDFWGWITCTLPPARSADQTLSIVFEGNSDNVLVNNVWQYATSIVSLAESKGALVKIDGKYLPEKLDSSSLHSDFKRTLKESREYWAERYYAAQKFMAKREGLFDDVLIEVAAQHPLKNRTVPNKEFEARLNKAIELYNRYTSEGRDVTIYVPGSRHQFDGIEDEVSLSTAGAIYLAKKGIPEECIIGDDANKLYKGEHGVYNSADECFVASEIYKNGQFEKLVCICSPNQLMRKTMFYIEFGCIPLCFGVTTEKMFHQNIVGEVFDSLNYVLYEDHSWQDENSEWFQYFRDTRKPKT